MRAPDAGFFQLKGLHASRTKEPLVELRDLYRLPLWVMTKAMYAYAPASLFFWMANIRGSADWLCRPLRREIAGKLERHLGEERDDPELRLIARRYMQFRWRSRFAMLWPQIGGFAGAEAIAADGLDHLDRALERGKGVILLSAHYGHSRLIKPILRSRGRHALLVGMPPGGPSPITPQFTRLGALVHDRLLRLPRRWKFDDRWDETVGTDLPAGINLRDHLAALARNEIMIVLADGRAAQMLRSVSVVGVEVLLSTGAVGIARHTGAAALPVFVVDDADRTESIGLRLLIGPPLNLQVTDNARADLRVNLAATSARP